MTRNEGVKRKNRSVAKTAFLAAMLSAIAVFPSMAAGGLELHSEYPGISVKPGDILSIPLSLDNTTGAPLNADMSITSLPEGWEGYIQGSSYEVQQVYVKTGNDAAELTFHLTVPKELEEGVYQASIHASAGGEAADDLLMSFNVAEENAGKGSFTSEYPEQEGTVDTTFHFSTTLINNGLKERSYSLSSDAPSGFNVSFMPDGDSTKKVASVDVAPGESKSIAVDVIPSQTADAGDYDISLSAVSSNETLRTDLSVTLNGTQEIDLSTPDGRLSFDAHAGKESEVTLMISNNGNEDIDHVTINSSLPAEWVVTYNLEDNIIDTIPAGTTKEVVASVKPAKDAITGDYVVKFTASAEAVSDSAEFRVTVKTSTIWGLAAIGVIVATICMVGYVFHKYGRR